jgi:hypothetical protein
MDPAFAPLLRGFELELEELDASDATILGVWKDLRLGYTNRAWARFAEANGGSDILERWPIGSSIAPAISGPLADWFRELVTGARSLRPAGLVYQCSSSLVAREFRLIVHPLSGAGLLLVHALIHQAPISLPAGAEPEEAAYRNAGGFLIQCSNCRCFSAADGGNRWNWIAAWVDNIPPQTSHGLCPVCAGIYYYSE